MERRQVGPARSDAEAGFRLDSACSTKGVGLKTKSDKGGQSEAESTDFRRGQKRGFESETGGWSPRDRKIRLQLETLLAEKGRLAQENSIYARENRFLREIVEYHNLTMQDVVHLDDGIEDIADDGTIHISLPYSSHSASEVISLAISSPHTPPDSPNSPNSDVQPDSSSPAAAPAPREDANEIRSSSSPKSELPHLILKPERAD